MQRVLTFLSVVMVFASNVFSMTINEAVSHALKNNPELQSLRLEKEVFLNGKPVGIPAER